MRKRILLVFCLSIIIEGVFAQGTNPFNPPSGVLPYYTVGVQYNYTINFTIPLTATVDPDSMNFPIDGIEPFVADVDTVKYTVVGLTTTGLSGVFDNGTGVYLAGTSGTLTITGIPTSSIGSSSIIISSLTSGSGTASLPVLGPTFIAFPGPAPIGGQNISAARGALDGGIYILSEMPVNIQDLNTSNAGDIQIFPNPTISEISITGFAPAYLKLHSTLGQTVVEASKSNKLYVGNLPQGLYVLQVFDEKGEVVKMEKVIVGK